MNRRERCLLSICCLLSVAGGIICISGIAMSYRDNERGLFDPENDRESEDDLGLFIGGGALFVMSCCSALCLYQRFNRNANLEAQYSDLLKQTLVELPRGEREEKTDVSLPDNMNQNSLSIPINEDPQETRSIGGIFSFGT